MIRVYLMAIIEFCGWLAIIPFVLVAGIIVMTLAIFGACWLLSRHKMDVDFADPYSCESAEDVSHTRLAA